MTSRNSWYNQNMENSGLIYVFTGDGKGKTSAALGVAMRAVGNGMKVAMVQWYKEASWRISEHELAKLIPGLDIYPMGKGFHLGVKTAPLSNGQVVVDKVSEDEHKEAAQAALIFARKLLPRVEVLILDEINNAVTDRLINLPDLIDLISKRRTTHLILTGRNAAKELIEMADLVTEMKKIKHPYDVGKLAVKGLDF